MKEFKEGDRFIPHKPKNDKRWTKGMDEWDGHILTVYAIIDCNDSVALVSHENYYPFILDWCEKVEELPNKGINEKILKEIFDLEQELGISQKLRFHNSETGHKKYEALLGEKLPNNHIPDVGKTIDWEQRRYELAKSALQGILSNPVYHHAITVASDERRVNQLRGLVDVSLQTAESMMELLKETEKQLKAE